MKGTRCHKPYVNATNHTGQIKWILSQGLVLQKNLQGSVYLNLSQLKAKIHIESTAGLVSKVQQSTPKEN